MNKLLNYIIVFLSTIVLAIIGLIAYRLLTFEKHTITFNLNGASQIDSPKLTCELSIYGCIIRLPNGTRENGKVIGYSNNKDDLEAKYQVGDEVLIHKDEILYAISYKDITITISQNDVDYLEKNSVNCLAYNENTSCKIKLPNFNKQGYQLAGYSQNKELTTTLNSYFQNEEYMFNDSMTLYPNYTSKRTEYRKMIYNTKDVYSINNSFMEFENTCSQNIVDTYKEIIDDINKKAPYLFVGTKINILSSNTFLRMWGGGGNTLGVNYHGDTDNYPLSRSLDILSSYGNDLMEKYYVVVHEMGHSFDFYYGYKMDMPKTITSDYYPTGGSKPISAQDDMKKLYIKYLYSYGQRPLRTYAYTSVQEFVAEAIAYYYLKYIVPTNQYQSSYYPDDLKVAIEKYFCIAKNNYNANGC